MMFGIAILCCMRNYIPLCLDCKFQDASQGAEVNSAGNSGGISAGNSGGISADGSKGISTSNSLDISMISLHSNKILTFWPRSTGSQFGSFSDEGLALMTSSRTRKC